MRPVHNDDDREGCDAVACSRQFRLDDCERDSCPKYAAVHVEYLDEVETIQLLPMTGDQHGLE